VVNINNGEFLVKRFLFLLFVGFIVLASLYGMAVSARGPMPVVVDSLEALNKAIAEAEPGAKIILKPGVYVFDEYKPALKIKKKNDISISSDGKAYIFHKRPTENVLYMDRCRNVQIRGIHFGHAPERGGCTGGVALLYQSENIKLLGGVFYGSGTVAVEAMDCTTVEVLGCALANCTERAVSAIRTNGFCVHNCLIAENDNPNSLTQARLLNFEQAANFRLEHNLILRNCLPFRNEDGVPKLTITGNVFAGNAFPTPPELLGDGGNREVKIEKTAKLPALLTNAELWPDDAVKKVAQMLLRFRNELKKVK